MTDDAAAMDAVAVHSPFGALTRRDLANDPFAFRSQIDSGGTAVLSTDDAGVVVSALESLEGWATEVHLLPPGVDVVDLLLHAKLLATDVDSTDAPPPPSTDGSATRWVLYTSGTTGTPKAIVHSLASLSRTIGEGSSESLVWGLTYDPNRMAGLQVILQALRSRSRLVAAAPSDPLRMRIDHLASHGVTALSATPSVWRQILQLPAAQGWPLRQITLGGEIADQKILDALGRAFPDARIVHVFASTETGAAFSVRDGREGFPIGYLEQAPRGIMLDVRDDILFVHSPGVSTAESDGFASTGDVVEVIGDRVLFRGRKSGEVNIGGSNVWPEVVESILRSHPSVAEAIVSARPNPMLGQVLVAAVSLNPGHEPADAPKQLRRWVRDNASRTHVPATVTVVDEIEVAATGKVVR